jgi:hypothetical protein
VVLVLMMVVVVVSVVWGSVNAHSVVELDACRPHVDEVEAARRQQGDDISSIGQEQRSHKLSSTRRWFEK